MEKVDKTDSHFPVGFLFRLAFLIEQIREKNHIENVPNPPTPSFVEPCIVSDPNPPGVSLP